ncbi:MAG TPA: hypothetical protein VIG46_01830 [Candidatus Baltobacteraceae bacterium]|jgi:hypothetical protein
MKIRRLAPLAVLVVALVAALTVSTPEPARADAPIYQALTSLRGLSNSSFAHVVNWARNGAGQVYAPTWDYQNAEAGILALPSGDRYAILQWLRGNGRGALYALGVTDNYIGPRRPGADYPIATPTPDPYRQLQFATDSLDGNAGAQPGNIQVLGGFAAARRDGTSILACVSFQNNAPQAATLVRFAFPIKDANGNTVATLHLDRKGTFSTGIGIHSYQSYNDWKSGLSNRGYADNCVTRTVGVAALPIIEARFATYAVTYVLYADGTSWTAPGATSP